MTSITERHSSQRARSANRSTSLRQRGSRAGPTSRLTRSTKNSRRRGCSPRTSSVSSVINPLESASSRARSARSPSSSATSRRSDVPATAITVRASRVSGEAVRMRSSARKSYSRRGSTVVGNWVCAVRAASPTIAGQPPAVSTTSGGGRPRRDAMKTSRTSCGVMANALAPSSSPS